jgi:hypothetical protein
METSIPQDQWEDQEPDGQMVQRDALRLLGIRGWRRRTENRDEWRHLMGEAKTRKHHRWNGFNFVTSIKHTAKIMYTTRLTI